MSLSPPNARESRKKRDRVRAERISLLYFSAPWPGIFIGGLLGGAGHGTAYFVQLFFGPMGLGIAIFGFIGMALPYFKSRWIRTLAILVLSWYDYWAIQQFPIEESYTRDAFRKLPFIVGPLVIYFIALHIPIWIAFIRHEAQALFHKKPAQDSTNLHFL